VKDGVSRRSFIATALGTAVVAGVGGYFAGSAAARPVERVITAATTVTERVREMVTVTQTVTPKLEPITIRWTTPQGRAAAAQVVAENVKEIAERHALKIEYNVVRGTGEQVRELVDGRADIIGPVTPAGLLPTMERNPSIKIVYFIDFGMYVSLLVGPNTPYKSLDDLRKAIAEGKKIKLGFSRPGSLSHTYVLILAHILGTKVGEGIEAVSIGEIDAIVAALTRGEIDGFPWSLDLHLNLEDKGIGRIIFLFSDYFGTNWHEFAFATTEDVMKRNPEIIRRFINYWRDVVRYYLLNKDKAIALMMEAPPKGLGYSRKVTEKYYDVYIYNYFGAPIKAALENVDYWSKQTGIVKNPPPIEKWYTTEFL
jgi:ABC-type nitrate/sulfonate/bicarbonate transport system substrate-binding protein